MGPVAADLHPLEGASPGPASSWRQGPILLVDFCGIDGYFEPFSRICAAPGLLGEMSGRTCRCPHGRGGIYSLGGSTRDDDSAS